MNKSLFNFTLGPGKTELFNFNFKLSSIWKGSNLSKELGEITTVSIIVETPMNNKIEAVSHFSITAITYFVNISFLNGNFQRNWKISFVRPLPKINNNCNRI